MLKGLLGWIMLHLLFSQILVLVQWNGVFHTVIETVIEEVFIETEENSVGVEANGEVVHLDPTLKDRNLQLMTNIKAAQERQAKLLETWESKSNLISYNIKQPSIYPDHIKTATKKRPAQISHLSQLLQKPTLSDFGDKALRTLLHQALVELDNIQKANVTADVGLYTLLHQTEWKREARTTAATSTCPPALARMSDLRALVRVFQLKLINITKAYNALLEDDRILSLLHQNLKNSIVVMPYVSQKPIEDEDNDRTVCLQSADLNRMVEMALQNPTQVQTTLPRLVQELGGYVILDSPLLRGTTRKSPRKRTPVNLRQALDSEVFVDTVSLAVDSLVEWTSGYHDRLDQFVDTLGGDSAGREAVSRILQLAGRLPLPQVLVNLYNNSKAGLLMNR
jgi:hypothetical protein